MSASSGNISVCLSTPQGLSVSRSKPAEGLLSAASAGQQQREAWHRSGWEAEARGHESGIFQHVRENVDLVKYRGQFQPDALCFRIKEGVLKEVMGIMVLYRVMVKLVIGGLASVFNAFDLFRFLKRKTPEKLILSHNCVTV